MILTASPCCQSAGARNRPDANPIAVVNAPKPANHGSRRPESRKNRPGFAKRCREPLPAPTTGRFSLATLIMHPSIFRYPYGTDELQPSPRRPKGRLWACCNRPWGTLPGLQADAP